MRRKRCLVPTSPFLIQEPDPSSFPVRARLIDYADRLLGVHDLTETFLSFILSLLTIKSRGKLISFLCEKGNPEDFIELEDELDDPSSIAENVGKLLNGRHKPVIGKSVLYKKLRQISQNEFPAKTQKSKTPLNERLVKLLEIFHLTEEDFKIVEFVYCHSQFKPFEDLCDSHKFPDYLRLLKICTCLPFGKIRHALEIKGGLLQTGIVEDLGKGCSPYYALESEVIDYLTGSDEIPLAEKYCRKEDREAFDLKTFSVPANAVNIIRSLLISPTPCHILLYGTAGTGKTEFAKAVIQSCGKIAFFVQHGKDGKVSERRLPLQVAAGTIPPRDGVLIVDEADRILNTCSFFFMFQEEMERGWLNNFLDQCPAKVIWITNEIEGIESSHRRRFAYSWHFKRFTKKERENIWAELIKGHPLQSKLTPELVKAFSAQYQVNAAGIGSALETVKVIIPPEAAKPETIRETIGELLTRHQDLTFAEGTKFLNPLPEQYDLRAVNIDVESDQLLASLNNYLGAGNDSGGMNLLFWGRPGTGKTEFAKFIASEMGLDLIIKRASDLLGPYVGQTEASIKDAFDEAKRQKAILFIDEADSFFIDRTKAHHSWETTQANELLTQMENYRGILICCTNLLRNLDSASLRRFGWKVAFKPLTEEGRVALFQNYFCRQGMELMPEFRTRLKSIPNLTAGDIKAVWQRFRFLAEPNRDVLSFITALEKEAFYKGEDQVEKIGF